MNHISISSYKDFPLIHPLYKELKQDKIDIVAYEKVQMNDVHQKNWIQLYFLKNIVDSYKKAQQRKDEIEWLHTALENPIYKCKNIV